METKYVDPNTHALMIRYREAYKVSDAVIKSGVTQKNIGLIVIGLFCLVAIFSMFSNIGRMFGDMAILGLIAFVIAGFVIGGAMIAKGNLMMSAGQTQMAMLDIATYASPLLAKEHKESVLRLPSSLDTEYRKKEIEAMAG